MRRWKHVLGKLQLCLRKEPEVAMTVEGDRPTIASHTLMA